MDKKLLWKFDEWYYYSSFYGIFIATIKEIDLIFRDGATLYLGESAGKHSEVQLDVNSTSFELVKYSENIPDSELESFTIGYNPINILLSERIDDLQYMNIDEVDSYLEEYNLLHLKEYLLLQIKDKHSY